VPVANTWHWRATWHGQIVPHCWAAGHTSFVWHGRAMLDP